MRAAAWRYEPSGERDLRLDLLRGLCLAKMVFNHLWKTPLHGYQSWLGYVTAAEGFFLLSGTVVGIVYGRRSLERGLGATGGAALGRAADLYLANLAFVVLFLAFEAVGVMPRDAFGLRRDFAWWHPFQLNQPYYLEVLPRYVVFLAATPLALWCLVRRRTAWLLAASVGLWLANLLAGDGLRIPGLEPPRHDRFPLLAWQVLFFVGMTLGFHRRRVAAWWRRLPETTVVSGLFGLCVLLALASQGVVPGPDALDPELRELVFGRRALGPGRLLNFAAFAAVAFVATDRLWRPLERFAGPLLLPFGQRSLYLFLVHIPVVWVGRALLPGFGAMAPHWGLLAVNVAVMILLLIAIRRRFLFGFLPT